jgi:alkylation response protein AidB-like acyl-CoA dehydrogenase
MNFELDRSQKEIQKAAREFAKGEFDKDLAQELDGTGSFPDQILEKAADLGFIGIHFPEDFSGGGLGVFENALIAEEFCKKDSTIGAAIMFSAFATEYLLRFGDDQQKKTFLPQVAEGKKMSGSVLGGFGGTKGIFPFAVKTTEGWKISGELDYVVNRGKAGLYCVPCSTGENDGKPDGLDIFLIDGQQEGVRFGESHDTLGLRMTPIAKMALNNVVVSQENRIGKENSGEKQTDRVTGELRVLLSALALGIAEGALDRSMAYVKQREQFGKKIAQFQVTQHKLAEMATQIEQIRYLTYCAASSFDNRKPDFKLAAMAKLTATRTAVAIVGEAIQLMGGYGYMKEYEVERFYRDAKTLKLIGGNTLILKDTIAKNVIGRIK